MHSISRWDVWELNDRAGYVKYAHGLVSVVIFKVLSFWLYTRISKFLPFLESLMENN